MGVEDLKIRELVERVRAEGIQEVIVCTSTNTEGQVTALYIDNILTPLGIAVTRPASGLSVGADIQNVDEASLGAAFLNRRRISER